MNRVKRNYNGQDLELQTMDAKTTYSILDPQTSGLVKDLLDDHDERVKKLVHSPELRPAQRVCPSPMKKRRLLEETRTSAFPGSTEISTARDVMSAAAPGRFHCKLRALAYWPSPRSNGGGGGPDFFRKVCERCRCECGESDRCGTCGGQAQKTVLLQLRLGDDTGTFDAIVAGREAEYFFTGSKGGDVKLDERLIVESLDSIVAESCDATPNVDCQIVSYVNEDETRVCYALHETTVTKLK